MRVLVSGASGLVGSAVARELVRRGHAVVALSRNPAGPAWPAGVEAVAWDAASPLPADLRADAVVGLAGEPIVGRRWTAAQKARLRGSRIVATRHLAAWANAQPRPPAFVSASAAGYYGVLPGGPCREDRPPGGDFLARLCVAWEAEARQARGRVAILRLGHVLSRDGGYLGALLPFARLRLAGPIGRGRQPMPWVHVEDVARAVAWAVESRASGAFNVASPGAAGCTQRQFAAALGRALGKPLQAPVPVLALRLRFGGGAAPALAGGQDLRVEAVEAAGFRFLHRDLDSALRGLLAGPAPAG